MAQQNSQITVIPECNCEHCKELRKQQSRAEEIQNQRRLQHAYQLLLQNHLN